MNKKVQLQKHKTVALLFLLTMAMVYIAMVYLLRKQPATWMGYVKAFSEAGMVGGLADWFAVTALFRYPLGLKIPHTNLIQKNKNALGKNLGDFVSENFLTPATIKPYIQKIAVSKYLKQWISKTSNQQLIAEEAVKIMQNAFQSIDDEKIERILQTQVLSFWQQLDIKHWLADGLSYLIEKNEHHRLLSLILPKAKIYVEENRDIIYKKIVENKPILGLIGGKSITNQLVQGIIAFFDEIENNAHHPLRELITEKLNETVEELQSTNKWNDKIEEIKSTFLTEQKINHYIHDFWKASKEEIHTYLKPGNKIDLYLRKYLQNVPHQLANDPELTQQIDKYVQKFVYQLALKNSHEIGTIIEKTIEEWDGKELSEKLEWEVGKDLQYIRINGTLVGGLVGLIIYSLTQLL